VTTSAPVWVSLQSTDGLLVTARRLDRREFPSQESDVNLSALFVLKAGQEVQGYVVDGDWASFVAVTSTDCGEPAAGTWEQTLQWLGGHGWRTPPYTAFDQDKFQATSCRQILAANNLREFAILERSRPGLVRGLCSVNATTSLAESKPKPTKRRRKAS